MSMSSTPQQAIVMKSLADDLAYIRAFHQQHDKVFRSRVKWFLMSTLGAVFFLLINAALITL